MSTSEQAYIFNQTQNPDDVHTNGYNNTGKHIRNLKYQPKRQSKQELDAWLQHERDLEEKGYAFDNGMIEED